MKKVMVYLVLAAVANTAYAESPYDHCGVTFRCQVSEEREMEKQRAVLVIDGYCKGHFSMGETVIVEGAYRDFGRYYEQEFGMAYLITGPSQVSKIGALFTPAHPNYMGGGKYAVTGRAEGKDFSGTCDKMVGPQ